MISDARGGHVSPGVYTEEKDITYAVKSLGITSLGLVGETVKGPAFQNIPIKDWPEFVDYFGGTSPVKYKGSGLPKYGLPYIAKEYLKESDNLNVVRVLGLSGYQNSNAYPLLFHVRKTSPANYPILILRSKGDYEGSTTGGCESKNEAFREYVTSIEISGATVREYTVNCNVSSATTTIPLSGYVKDGVVYDTMDSGSTIENFGKIELKVTVSAGTPYSSSSASQVYTYTISLNPEDKDYVYNILPSNPLEGSAPIYIESLYDYAYRGLIENAVSGTEVWFSIISGGTISGGTSGSSTFEDYTDYKEPYRCAMTPWLVSEVNQGVNYQNIAYLKVKKLFRFYTISDGDASNYQVKISIERIRPEDGLFDVVIRDFYDSDVEPMVLEKYSSVSLVEGSSNYLGFRIGTYDGEYETKSKYVTVEISHEEGVESSVPCGFLGYPIPKYGGNITPKITYNTKLNPNIKTRRQFFGLNSSVLDEDILNYKGYTNYSYEPSTTPSKLTNGFHLDSIFENLSGTIYVDDRTGFTFSSVDSVQVGSYTKIPRILTESYMKDTIYKDMSARKFTVYPYGGFDGWDIYREERTNTNKYKATMYPIVSGSPFTSIGTDKKSGDFFVELGLPTTGITSDYYAYLGGYLQFANPEDVDINIFATPGIMIDENYSSLVEDALDVIEDKEDGRGGDTLYVVDTPQGEDAEDVVAKVDSTDIDSSYAATYWPWVKYFDESANKYILLPPTKDVVRNMAWTDNKLNPWFAPAGTSRGKMNVTKAGSKTRLPEEDILYANRINPIKTFAKDGVLVWGNKTLYSKDSPLNRINVRRLMLRVKKLVTLAARDMVFENMDESLDKQFRSLVEPILADVKSKKGIVDFYVKTENTKENRDQHYLPAAIGVKPVNALEYISISFNIYPESVDFEE